jgi:8-oxo-dGTP pyrophosphatase MutT (NUDIX family)
MVYLLKDLEQNLNGYEKQFPEETATVNRYFELMDSCREGVFSRKNLPGHITTSAFVLGKDGRMAMIYHNALQKYLQPGGHVESDVSLVSSAKREVMEEIGFAELELMLDGVPIDLDIHDIPANDAKGEPLHQHFDVRFLFRTSELVPALQLEEVSGMKWFELGEVREISDEFERVIRKIEKLS